MSIRYLLLALLQAIVTAIIVVGMEIGNLPIWEAFGLTRWHAAAFLFACGCLFTILKAMSATNQS